MNNDELAKKLGFSHCSIEENHLDEKGTGFIVFMQPDLLSATNWYRIEKFEKFKIDRNFYAHYPFDNREKAKIISALIINNWNGEEKP